MVNFQSKFFVLLCFKDRVSLGSPDWPRTYYVDQANPKLRALPAFVSQLLGLSHHPQSQLNDFLESCL